IDPTPVVGVVGVIDCLDRRPPGIDLVNGGSLVMLGSPSSSLGGSRWCRELRGTLGGPLPALDLASHADLCSLVRRLAVEALELNVVGIHDISDGGLALALAELCCRSMLGVVVSGVASVAELFAELPARVVVCTNGPDESRVLAAASDAGVPAGVIGSAGGDRLVVEGLIDLPVADLRRLRSARLPDAAAQPAR
ncbi:MAG: AIR synthase-related protein, partial [Acidimicrobiales bacterium]